MMQLCMNTTSPPSKKAHKREKDLRRQLSESSTRQEEQNKKIDALEDRVRALLEEAERYEEAKKASRDALSKLKVSTTAVLIVIIYMLYCKQTGG